ncbi:MAG: hypothetical protein EXS35_03160 [Pedosphaera sp.]|nr:hypothetical protein [Pedosphaera sp.]
MGAGVGLLAGAIAGDARRNYYYDTPGYAYSSPAVPSVNFGYGYSRCGSSAFVYLSPNSYCAPNYYYRAARPNYAVSGTLLGAASGALIGAGTRDAGKGAAIGAAAGLVLGGVAEASARNREQRTAAALQSTPAPPPQPQVQVTAPSPPTQDSGLRTQDSNNQVTSKPGPTSTYHWTSRPQIADAARVPDAPKF